MLQSSGKLPGKAVPSRQGSNLGPNAQQSKVGTRISMGKAGSIACLEELEEAGKKKQMAEWSSDRYAARQAHTSPRPRSYTAEYIRMHGTELSYDHLRSSSSSPHLIDQAEAMLPFVSSRNQADRHVCACAAG